MMYKYYWWPWTDIQGHKDYINFYTGEFYHFINSEPINFDMTSEITVDLERLSKVKVAPGQQQSVVYTPLISDRW